jgi:hypothetical protein
LQPELKISTTPLLGYQQKITALIHAFYNALSTANVIQGKSFESESDELWEMWVKAVTVCNC